MKNLHIYLCGPMRGLPEWNFPAFDEAEKRWREAGHYPASPAQVDRALGVPPSEVDDPKLTKRAITLDISLICHSDAIALLPGWERSRGAAVELALAQFLNLPIYDAITMELITPLSCPWRLT